MNQYGDTRILVHMTTDRWHSDRTAVHYLGFYNTEILSRLGFIGEDFLIIKLFKILLG